MPTDDERETRAQEPEPAPAGMDDSPWADLRRGSVELGGIELEIPPREEMVREPPDFAGAAFGPEEDDAEPEPQPRTPLSAAEVEARFKHLPPVDAESLRRDLDAIIEPSLGSLGFKVEVAHVNGTHWEAFVVGIPIVASGDTLDDLVVDLVDAVREYAEDWSDHLRTAPNHRDNWAFVQAVEASDDDQLRTWLVG